jgi:type VI protein secretion system component Hcp
MPVAAHYLEIIDHEGVQILGESEGHDYIDHIDVNGWDWDVVDRSATDTGSSKDAKGSGGSAKATAGGAEVGVEPSVFSFTKPFDSSTTRLMTAMHRGEVLKLATFTLLEELMGLEHERRGAFRLHVVLEKVIVVGYRLDASTSEFRVDLEETWDLNYTNIAFLYETERMRAEFDRNPGATRTKSKGPEPDFLVQLRKYGIEPARKGRGQRE